MANGKTSGVELLGLPARGEAQALGIGQPVSPAQQPAAAPTAPAASVNPIQQQLMDLLGDDLEGIGSGALKVQTGLKLAESEFGADIVRGTLLQQEGLDEADKMTRINAKIAGVKQVLAGEKAKIEQAAASQKRVQQDFKIRETEINMGIANGLTAAKAGQNDLANKIITDQVNASLSKAGMKAVITNVDPNSLAISGFTFPVDANGQPTGASVPLENETIQGMFQGVDITSALTLSEQKSAEARAAERSEREAVEQTLGRVETQAEREIRGGVRRAVQPTQEVSPTGFGGLRQQTIEDRSTLIAENITTFRGQEGALIEAINIIDDADTGAFAQPVLVAKKIANQLGISDFDTADTESVGRLNAELLKPFVAQQGRNFSDADREFFGQAVPNISNSRDANRRVSVGTLMAGRNDLERERLVNDLVNSGADDSIITNQLDAFDAAAHERSSQVVLMLRGVEKHNQTASESEKVSTKDLFEQMKQQGLIL